MGVEEAEADCCPKEPNVEVVGCEGVPNAEVAGAWEPNADIDEGAGLAEPKADCGGGAEREPNAD